MYVSVVDDSVDPPIPLLVTRDPAVLRAIEDALGRRLRGGGDPETRRRALARRGVRLLDEDAAAEEEDR